MARRVQKTKIGDVFSIELQDGRFCYAQALNRPLFAFFDYADAGDVDINLIGNAPVAFKIWIMNDAVNSSKWKKIGNTEPSQRNLSEPTFRKKDKISGAHYKYRKGPDLINGYEEVRSNLDDVQGLEVAAVWGSIHIEDRPNDYFSGRENKWVRALERENS